MSDRADVSDAELLRRFAGGRNQDAFTELVKRHLSLVYSAALRQVRSPQLAEEVAQSVFADLARDAGKLKPDAVVVAWLHLVTRRTAVDVIRKESRRQLREQIAVGMNAMNTTEATWPHIEPLLDEAVSALDETDRAAVLLRYFENKSLREVGAQLGVSEGAAQKRLSRAVEQLREYFGKRKVAVGASGLIVLISANAVQAAPVALITTISAAGIAACATTTATATVTATKVIAMTTLQKTIVGAAVAAAVGTGVYETRQASTYRAQAETLQQQQAPLVEQVQQLQQERAEASNQIAALTEEVERLSGNKSELLRLRAETSRLRNAAASTPTVVGKASSSTVVSRGESSEATGNATELVQEASRLWQTGKLGEALTKFEAAVKLDPKNTTAWNGLGWVRFNTGKKDGAAEAFEKVVELEPDHAAALNGLGQLYLSQKKYDQAENYLLKASPKAPAAWYGLAKMYLLQDKFDQAEKWAQAIIDSGQGDEGSRALLKAAKDKSVSPALRLMIDPQ